MAGRGAENPLWDRWEEIDALFGRLLDAQPEEREARIAEWTAGDAELERVLRNLLGANDEDPPLGRPLPAELVGAALADATGRTSNDGPNDDVPERIGPYRIVRPLGRGGMATVFLAERDDPDFPQRVALKVLRRGVDTDDVIRRFRAERQILARLHHPNIASIFDAGTTADGRPYLVLEYVEGSNLIEHCDRLRLDLPARLELFMAVARAVSHAHARGVVHGDLKPSNILVTEDEQHVRLLDFGISRILSPSDEGRLATQPGSRPMTPGSASPEQLQGLPVDERSDIYQLGLLLYELLTGRQPFRDRARTGAAAESHLTVPPAPSRVADPEAADARCLDHKGLIRALSGDLDNVVLQALQGSPGDRYASAREFHDDVARCLDRVPVRARRGAAQRLRRRVLRGASRAAVVTAVGAGLWLGASAYLRGSRSEPAARPPPIWVALGPITETTPTPTQGLSLQVAELLATNLARNAGIQVVELQRWGGGSTPVRPEAIEDAADAAGAEKLLTGTLHTEAENRLTLEVVRVGFGSREPATTYRVEGADPFALVDRMTEAILLDLGLAPSPRGVATVTTGSPVAYRLYEEGLRVYHQGDRRAAYRLFTAALDEDPRFAMAVYHRALTNEDVDHAAFRDDLLRAVTYAEQASDRERLVIRNAWALEMDEPSQPALADSLVARFPAEPVGHLFAGHALAARGDFLEATREFARAGALATALEGGGDPGCLICDALEGTVGAYLLADSLEAAERVARRLVDLTRESANSWRVLASTLEYQGRTPEALIARNLAATLGSVNPRDGVFEAVLALRAGDFPKADSLLARESDVVDPLVWQNVLWYRMLSARYQGRMEEAFAAAVQYREVLEDAESSGHSPLWAPLLEAVVLEESGRPDLAAELWRQIAAGPYEPESPSRTARHRAWTLAHAAGAHRAAGDTALLPGLADTIQALGSQSAYGRDPRLHEYVRGLSLMERGDTAAAAESFSRAVYSLTGGYGRINLELGRALLALGRPAEAIPVLRGALRGPLDAANLYVNRTDLHRLLAAAYASSSMPDSASVHFSWVERAVGAQNE